MNIPTVRLIENVCIALPYKKEEKVLNLKLLHVLSCVCACQFPCGKCLQYKSAMKVTVNYCVVAHASSFLSSQAKTANPESKQLIDLTLARNPPACVGLQRNQGWNDTRMGCGLLDMCLGSTITCLFLNIQSVTKMYHY